MEALVTGNKITSSSHEAFSLYEKARWGERKQSHIEYTMLEALALVALKKMQVRSGTKSISESLLLKKAKRSDKRAEVKLAVLRDLRKKGYIVKTALKFGAEFRVYDKGIKPGQDHAAWLLMPVKENEPFTWYDFAAKSRIATSTNKKLMLAIVDDADDVTYYQVNWMRP
ncbi:MAG: tRNA-intron lyase [Nanoarchaeota archaeon]